LTLALLAGLGLSNHHSIVLRAPIGLAAVFWGLSETTHRLRAVALAPLALLVGLTPYLYLFIATSADAAWIWRPIHNVSDLLHHFLRRDYGTFNLSSEHQGFSFSAQMLHFGHSLLRFDVGIGAVLATLGALITVIKPLPMLERSSAQSPTPWAWRWLLLSALLCGPGFLAQFNLLPEGVTARIVERFHMLPALLGALLAGRAFDAIVTVLSPRISKPTQRLFSSRGCAIWIACLLLFASLRAFPMVVEVHNPAVDRYTSNMLKSLPPNAIVVGMGDHNVFGFLYQQRARGLRPDVLYIDLKLLQGEVYRGQIESVWRSGPLIPEGDGPGVQRLLGSLLASGRPVYMTRVLHPEINRYVSFYPEGVFARVVALGTPLPSPLELEAKNLEHFQGFDLDYKFPRRADTWAGVVHETYAQPWVVLIPALASMGELERAAAADARVDALRSWQ